MARRHRGALENPRPLWIAGLAGAAVLLVGGIALAATSKKGGGGGGGGPQPLPTSAPTTPLQQAAARMADALIANGYRQSDQTTVYQPFQAAAGFATNLQDGYPGTATMSALDDALKQMGASVSQIIDGYTKQQIVVYPWPVGAYDGVHAPSAAEWNR